MGTHNDSALTKEEKEFIVQVLKGMQLQGSFLTLQEPLAKIALIITKLEKDD